MRNSATRAVLGLLAIATLAAAWVMPSYADAPQVPGTLAKPGMSAAQVWINNKTPEESIPVNIVVADPRAVPLPVSVTGIASVDFTDRAVGALNQIHGRTQPTSSARQPWEYRDVAVGPNQSLAGALTALGNDGWEAAGLTTQPNGSVTVLLKRPR